MTDDPIRGSIVRWSYDDGPVAGMTFEHTFAPDGTVTYRQAGAVPGPSGPGYRYELERITDTVYAVSYLSKANGYTLTTVIDLDAKAIVSFASNEKELVVQHGRLVSVE